MRSFHAGVSALRLVLHGLGASSICQATLDWSALTDRTLFAITGQTAKATNHVTWNALSCDSPRHSDWSYAGHGVFPLPSCAETKKLRVGEGPPRSGSSGAVCWHTIRGLGSGSLAVVRGDLPALRPPRRRMKLVSGCNKLLATDGRPGGLGRLAGGGNGPGAHAAMRVAAFIHAATSTVRGYKLPGMKLSK